MKKYLIILVTLSLLFTISACYKNPEKETQIIEDDNSPDIVTDSTILDTQTTIETPVPPTEPSDNNDEVINVATPTTQTNYAYYLSSNVDSLNVRSGNSSTASKLGSINKGDMLSYKGESGNWYRTVYKEKDAYVHKDYVQIVKIAKGNEQTEKVIDVGLSLLGYPYVYGSERYHWGNGRLNSNFVPGKYDCSALMQYMFYFGSGDILEVTSKKQFYQGKAIDELKRGDLMFFTNANGYYASGINRVRHVGMYLGDNYILHTASDYAVIEPISQKRWEYFITARRIID